MPVTEKSFARDEVYPSWYPNALGEFLSVAADGFSVTKQDATHIQVVAGPNDQAATVAIEGRWRFIEATVSRAHPGGAAGTYDIYVTAADNDIVAAPAPYTDVTNYGFALAVVAAGATPAIVAGTVDIYRKVGSLQWDGAQITRIDQTVPLVHNHAHSHATGQADAIAPADIGAVATGGVASLSTLEVTGAGTALVVDHDAAIDGALNVAGNQTVGGTLGVTGASTLAAVTATGLITGRAGLTLDVGAGTAGQTLTLVGRNAGAANSATASVSSTGTLTFNVPGGQSYAFQVAGTTAATFASNGVLTATGFIGDMGVANSGPSLTLVGRNAGNVTASASLAVTPTGQLQSSAPLGHSWFAGATSLATLTALGQLQMPVQGVNGGLLLGGDATLYRDAANSLRTGAALTVDGASTFTGAVLGRAGLTLDAGTNNSGQTITLNGRSGGGAVRSSTLAVDSTGALTVTAPNSQTFVANGLTTLILGNNGAAATVGFYSAAPVAQVAAPAQVRVNSATNVSGGTAPAALTANSTLGDVIAHVSRVANVLQGLGLLGSGGAWSS